MRRHNNPQDKKLYDKWRRTVRKRDGYKCQWSFCNCRTDLETHHILEWSSFPHLRYSVNNGITLCKTHHKMIKGKEVSYAPIFNKIVLEKIKNAKSK